MIIYLNVFCVLSFWKYCYNVFVKKNVCDDIVIINRMLLILIGDVELICFIERDYNCYKLVRGKCLFFIIILFV